MAVDRFHDQQLIGVGQVPSCRVSDNPERARSATFARSTVNVSLIHGGTIMKKVLPYLGASLSVLAASWATAAMAQDTKPFTDVPPTHWAYEAVTYLQQKDILKGYPEGYFKGKRTLTRYEFAVALQRALATIPTPNNGKDGAQGPPGPQGEPGPAGPPGMTPDEVAQLRALTQEFKNDLAQLGANVKDIQNRLDALSRDVADIKDRLNKMIQFNGELFAGFRSDRSRYDFIDYGGTIRHMNGSMFQNVDSLNDFHLKATGNLPGGVKATVDLVTSNYLSYAANGATGNLLGSGGANPNATLPQQTTLYQAQLSIPINGFGNNTELIIGRFKNQVTPLTYYRPDTDPYFNLPWYNDGNYVQDGFMLESKFGSARTSLWAGSYTNLTATSAGFLLNRPLVGAVYGPRTFAQTQPFGLSYNPFGVGAFGDDRGQILPNQSAGLHVGIPIKKIGEFGATIIDFGGGATTPNVGAFFNNVVVYGLNFKLRSFGRFNISGEAAKSVTQLGISNGDPSEINEDNNAFNLNLSYNSGPIKATATYQYIDPRFGAPGYWNKIGNWYNPTNIQGPGVRVNYDFTKSIVGYLGGDWYSGARNRVFNGGTVSETGLTTGSSLLRAVTGVKYNINKRINVGADYEGVFWDLSGAVTPTGGRSKPIEQFITAKVGLNLASNTVLNLAYQIISSNDAGGGFGTVVPGVFGSAGGSSNASVFTTQVAVKF